MRLSDHQMFHERFFRNLLSMLMQSYVANTLEQRSKLKAKNIKIGRRAHVRNKKLFHGRLRKREEWRNKSGFRALAKNQLLKL